MRKYLTLIASFFIMLCLGGIYAWSIVVTELIGKYGFTASQAQLVFGVLIAIFPITMIFAGEFSKRMSSRILAMLAAIFFSAGYLLSGFSQGNFFIILLGIGVFTGIGTGLGYLVALTSPVKWFPTKKGLITGIAAAGFGLAATILTIIIEALLKSGKDILEIFSIIGICYGLLIFLLANFIKTPDEIVSIDRLPVGSFIKTMTFFRLFLGMFMGTFAGLLVIGSLNPIGAMYSLPNHTLILGVSVFALANFLGRISWGFICDYLSADLTVFLALAFQAIAIFLLDSLSIAPITFILLSAAIGFGFGGNFVLFAKETAQVFGVSNLATIYPYVFLGYALAGILGPLTGGALFDHFKNFNMAIYIAAAMSAIGALLFLITRPQSGINEHLSDLKNAK